MRIPIQLVLFGLIVASSDGKTSENSGINLWMLFARVLKSKNILTKNPNGTEPRCGVTGVAAPTGATGGAEAGVGQFPWQVALSVPVLNQVICGGSYVHGYDGYVKVVTAWHCVDLIVAHDIPLHVTFNLHDRSQRSGSLTLLATKVIPHPDANLLNTEHDIAIIEFGKLISEMEQDAPGAKPICLARAEPDPAVVSAYASGWGTTLFGHSTNKLKYAKVSLVPLPECQKKYMMFLFPVKAGMICAGDGLTDTCVGDSGGPLAIQNSDGVWQLLGVDSWGLGCGVFKKPIVYTSTVSHMEWLLQNI